MQEKSQIDINCFLSKPPSREKKATALPNDTELPILPPPRERLPATVRGTANILNLVNNSPMLI
jgi:hypothetical protein